MEIKINERTIMTTGHRGKVTTRTFNSLQVATMYAQVAKRNTAVKVRLEYVVDMWKVTTYAHTPAR